jgi:RimJ/RimL family protein N-acetyltransferase
LIRTDRLVLREWRDDDLEPFAVLNAHREVMRWFPAPLSRAESDALAARIRREMAEWGFGLWAVESPGEAPFLGFIGLSRPAFDAHFTPCVEIGWRIGWRFWGKGYATEGARGVLAHGFGELGLREIVSFTTRDNAASRGVMERLGMTRDPAEDFDHPSLAAGHPLRAHVLYRMTRERWEAEAR